MVEPGYKAPLSSRHSDLATLQQQARSQRRRYRQFHRHAHDIWGTIISLVASPLRTLQNLPTRYVLHALVALVVPLALALTQLPTLPLTQPTAQPTTFADMPTELGPLSLASNDAAMQVGDPPLDSESIPMPISLVSRQEALAPLVVPASISVGKAKLRTGPGLDYDHIEYMPRGSQIEVIGRFNDWFQVREAEGKAVYWVSGEVLDIPQAAVYTLFEVPTEKIPPPPPPKIGAVREDGLNLRDGPGTNYVKMISLNAGNEVSLVERYQDWYHVVSGDNDGWVHSAFLEIGNDIMRRIPVAQTIPDPNPPLIGSINDNSVNLRKGPGTAYSALGKVNADTQVDLLARHKDWFKVKIGGDTTAWVFSDLLDITPMAKRRVPHTNDIPALPRRYVAVNRGGGGGGGGGGGTPAAASASSSASYIPASGDVASYALRFVGSPYVYGAAGPGAFDCSGFTSYVYRQYGVYLPHSAAAQFSTAYGASVGSMNNLAPGDLVFFAGTYRRGISHVAIYIGGGRIVHAMTPRLGVQVSSIWSSYWSSHYYGAIRVRR